MRLDRAINTYNNLLYFLLQNEDLCKLLYYDSYDSLELPTPSLTIDEWFEHKYVFNTFPGDMDIENSEVNSHLILVLDTVIFRDDSTDNYCDLYCITDNEHWNLNNHKHRPLEMMNIVTTLLDKHKSEASGQIRIVTMDFVSAGKFKSGYKLRLSYSDQNIREVEI
jgi:hypothetical protein